MLHAMTARCALIALLCGPAAGAEIAHTSSWIGNTWAQPVDGKWVQNTIADLFVAADGTCYADDIWDEAGATGALYRGGTTMIPAGHMFGWGCGGSRAVTANATHVFFGMSVHNEGGHLVDAGTWPPAGRKWYGLTRRLRSDITKAATFAGAKGGAGDTLAGSFLLVSEVADGVAADVAGLACDDNRVWYADPQAGLVRIIDARSMASIGSFPFTAPGKIALDRAGTLWICQTTTKRIVHCSATGALLGGDIADAGDPTALAIDVDGRLLVGDSSARSQVLTYDI